MEKVYVPKTPQEKAMQRALLQYFLPKNKEIVLAALKRAKRLDLIGAGPKCLVNDDSAHRNANNRASGRAPSHRGNDSRRGGRRDSSLMKKRKK